MKKVISSSEWVDTARIEGALWKIYATAEASYNESSHCLWVKLDRQLRTPDGKLPVRTLELDWLPSPLVFSETVPFEDALEASKEIFKDWVFRIRKALQKNHELLTPQIYDTEIPHRV